MEIYWLQNHKIELYRQKVTIYWQSCCGVNTVWRHSISIITCGEMFKLFTPCIVCLISAPSIFGRFDEYWAFLVGGNCEAGICCTRLPGDEFREECNESTPLSGGVVDGLGFISLANWGGMPLGMVCSIVELKTRNLIQVGKRCLKNTIGEIDKSVAIFESKNTLSHTVTDIILYKWYNLKFCIVFVTANIMQICTTQAFFVFPILHFNKHNFLKLKVMKMF